MHFNTEYKLKPFESYYFFVPSEEDLDDVQQHGVYCSEDGYIYLYTGSISVTTGVKLHSYTGNFGTVSLLVKGFTSNIEAVQMYGSPLPWLIKVKQDFISPEFIDVALMWKANNGKISIMDGYEASGQFLEINEKGELILRRM